ncbi:unnamed protein product [Adineta steineri]|uniref:Uncharacterized protein n=1 Tax=Adineta steineri TaxID=433720 RepID=A0A818JPR0_9BILA|nr:unnamed protein product [Adineta steineri]CAF1026964.1 unnamed protein product [Adineta steineri]CAF1131794.1 unnamed protein product [Adineta steineri]CAF3546451.1 unnamed protein product [Adineta steineri]CAF4194283.1 unnamed protein product [Adineta steineri]
MVDFDKRSFWNFTFKDILTFLCSAAIPIALAIYTAIGSEQQKQEARETRQFDLEQSIESRQQILYDEFLNNIFKLDRYSYLKEEESPWAYYRAAHRQLDKIRKGDALQFLKEKQLIGRNNCTDGCRTTHLGDIIRLNELNFDNVRLASQVVFDGPQCNTDLHLLKIMEKDTYCRWQIWLEEPVELDDYKPTTINCLYDHARTFFEEIDAYDNGKRLGLVLDRLKGDEH